MTDEQAIRQLVQKWLDASKAGDITTVLSLMSDDVIFMVPGQEPFGRETFAANAERMRNLVIDGRSDIQELNVADGWAWMRNRLNVTITSPDGKRVERDGYTLTILRKTSGGNWVIARDANLMT